MSGVTSLLGGGTGPAAGTNATTCRKSKAKRHTPGNHTQRLD